MAKKKNILIDNYEKSWKTIKEAKRFIFFSVGIFLVFALIGFFVPPSSYLSNLILSYIKDIINQTSSLSLIQLISFIFFNNLRSSFFGIVFGVFLGIFPAFIALFNGYILGFVASESVKTSGILVLWKLFPHGIFELPAVFTSLGLGMQLASKLFQKKKRKFWASFIDALRVFLFVVVPLLIIAAIIEGTLIILVH